MSDPNRLLLERAQAAHARVMEDMIWGSSSSRGWTTQTSMPEFKWPTLVPRYLYIEQEDIHPSPGETGIYAVSDTFFPGARVWLGPPRSALPPETRRGVDAACPDVLTLATSAEDRARLLAAYWPTATG